ncbi:MAG: asparagine synthase (glutamine-hydrolyzing) [Phycisphaerales bacterium]
MCGICGIVDFAGRIGRDELARIAVRMRDALRHRGPDDAGLWTSDDAATATGGGSRPGGGAGVRVALGHRRLSIVDLRPEARQPMGNEDGGVQVVFNGEIYGFQPLKDRLAREGHVFVTRTDTEVLPHLFESCDPREVPAKCGSLDGMFAFAAWNVAEQRLVLARDPFGKKPLYWMLDQGVLAFASELRCFAFVPGFRPEIDRDALGEYLLLQYVHAPRTIHPQVRKLEPGSCATIEFSGGSPRVRLDRYWRFEATGPARRPTLSLDAAADALRAILLEAVQKRLMSDVPLGAFLSGGVDSSLVVALMRRELGRAVETFSIGFAGTDESEHEFARETARHLGATHRDEILSPDVMSLVHTIAERLDEPNGDSSCLPTYLLCEHARRHVTVAISGDGGDELFGGYGRYRDTLNEHGSAWRRLAARLRGRATARASDLYLSPRLLIWQPEDVGALLGGLPTGVDTLLATWRAALDDPSLPLLDRLRTLDAATYMPGAVLAKVDRMSMLHSLEVRCPLLDKEVAAFAMRIDVANCWRGPAETKRVLKHLASRYLPPEWMNRRKMGFGLPANSWSPEPMLALAHDTLLAPDGRIGALLDRAELRRRIEHMRHPGCFSIYRLWPLVVLELWMRRR